MRVVDIKDLDLSILPTKYNEQYRSFDIYPTFERDLEFDNKNRVDIKEYKYLENKEFYNIYAFDNNLDLNGLDDFFKVETSKNFQSINSLFKLNSFITPFQKKLTVKKLDKPLNIINIFEKTNNFYAQSLHIVFEDDTEVVETFYSKKEIDSFINANREYQIKKDKQVSITKLQLLNQSSLIFNCKTTLETNCNLNLTFLEYKAKLSLNIFDTLLNAKNSAINIQGVLKLDKNQKGGNIAFINHLGEETKSDIKIKHLLDGKSHALFDITSKVQNSAFFSKAVQNSQTILLSDDARINANPRLEIYVDELEASHGASCGSLDEDQLYYLCSRGISKRKAKEIIIESIELQIIDNITSNSIKEYINKLKG